MRNDRQFLKGLGMGFILGAILLQLMLRVQEADGRMEPPPGETAGIEAAGALDAETFKAKAPSFGLKVLDEKEKTYSQEQLDDAVKKAGEEAKAKSAAAQPSPSTKPITVYIPEGMSAAQVVDYFYRSGIVADRAAFETGLGQGQLSAKIRNGLYSFNLNEDVKDVIAKLTTPPKY